MFLGCSPCCYSCNRLLPSSSAIEIDISFHGTIEIDDPWGNPLPPHVSELAANTYLLERSGTTNFYESENLLSVQGSYHPPYTRLQVGLGANRLYFQLLQVSWAQFYGWSYGFDWRIEYSPCLAFPYLEVTARQIPEYSQLGATQTRVAETAAHDGNSFDMLRKLYLQEHNSTSLPAAAAGITNIVPLYVDLETITDRSAFGGFPPWRHIGALTIDDVRLDGVSYFRPANYVQV